MTGLQELPTEIILQILSSVGFDEDTSDFDHEWALAQSTLLSFCRTCKLFRKIAEEALCSRAQIAAQNLARPESLSFMTALTAHPDLSQRVKHLKLTFGMDGGSHAATSNAAAPPSSKVLELVKGMLEDKRHPERTQESTLLDLLVGSLPNLETLHLSPLTWGPKPYLQEPTGWAHPFSPRNLLQLRLGLPGTPLSSVEHGGFSAPRFSRLRRVILCPEASGCFEHLDVSTLHYFFRRIPPSCTSLHARYCDSFSRLPSRSYRFRELILDKCQLRTHDLEFLSSAACEGLVRFKYTSRSDLDPMAWLASPQQCLAALERHSHTLTDLHLEAVPWAMISRPSQSGGFGSFARFTKLEKLCCHPLDFGNLDIDGIHEAFTTFPNSLPQLTLTQWSETAAKHLAWLGNAAARGEFPNLKTITIQCYTSCAGYDVEKVRKKLGENIGTTHVQTKVLKGRFDDYRL